MKSEEIFGIIVRAVGLWELAMALEGIAAISGGFSAILGIVVNGAIGGILFFNAEVIVQAAYRPVSHEPE